MDEASVAREINIFEELEASDNVTTPMLSSSSNTES